jgi:hypothetical protein
MNCHPITMPVFTFKMSILSSQLHSSKYTIRLSFHLENINCESLNDNGLKFSIACNLHVLGWRPQHSVFALQLIVGCTALVAVAIPYVRCVHEVHLPVHDGLVFQKHASSDSNPASWLAMEENSWLPIEGRHSLPLNNAAWRCHP